MFFDFLGRRLVGSFLLLLGLAMLIQPVEANQDAAVQNGETWLLSQQAPNGNFGNIPGLEPRDSATTVLALAGRSTAEPGLTRGSIFLQNIGVANAPFHARRAKALAASGRPVDTLLADLLQFENGGGVGASFPYHSNLLDTALVVEALSLEETAYLLTINRYLDYLQLHQRPDGGWGFLPDDDSDLYTTSIVLRALIAPRQLVVSTQVLDRAASFLLARQLSDGSFGDPLTTAVVFQALLAADMATSDFPFGSPSGALLSAQRADGSWEGDVLTTSQAMQALRQHLPNLVIASLSVHPLPLQPGQSATVQLTVENRGGRLASPNTVSLRLDGIEGPLLEEVDVPALDPEAQHTLHMTLPSETSLAAGPFLDLHAAVDSSNQVQETNESDNQEHLRIDLSTPADLAVWASDLQTTPSVPLPGDTFDLLIPVRNLGEEAAPSVAWTLHRIQGANSEALAAGSVASLTGGDHQILTVPLTLAEGDHTLEIRVDSDLQLTEPQEENNVTSWTLSLVDPTRPDLVLEDGDLHLQPEVPQPGEAVDVQWTLRNTGDQEAETVVALYARNAAGLSDAPLATWQQLVPPNSTIQDGATVTPPPSAHSLVLIADPDDLVRELDEANNQTQQVFRPLSDLAIGWDNLTLEPGQPIAGEITQVRVTVRNRGFIAAQQVDVELRSATSGELLASQQIDAIPAQGNRSIDFQWSASPGRTDLVAIADPDGALDELDESNNSVLRRVFTSRSSGPDLGITSVDASELLDDAVTARLLGPLTVEVHNDGDSDVTSPFRVSVFDDQNGDGARSAAEPELASVTVDQDITVGTSRDVILQLDSSLAFRHALLWIDIDPEDLIPERQEDDNLATLWEQCPLDSVPGSLEPIVEWQLAGLDIESSPLVVQLSDDNGDGFIDSRDTPDVVFMAEDNSGRGIFARQGSDGGPLWTLRSSPTHPLPLPIGNMAAADLDGDGVAELLAPRRDGRLMALDHRGDVLWISDVVEGLGDRWAGGITVGELDGQGGPEIVVGRAVLSHRGELVALGTANRGRNYNHYGPLGVPLVPGAQDYPHSVIADVDLDGQNEIITGDTAYRLVNGALQVVWDYDEPGQLMVDGFSAVGQLDGDEEAEIVVVSSNAILVLHHDGTVARNRRQLTPFAPFTRASFWGGPPTLADLDGDGTAEILVTTDTEVLALEADLTTRWRAGFNDVAAIVGLTAFDFDGDGSREVLALDNEHFYILDGANGQALYTLPNTSKTATELPVVADVDGDGRAEILLPSNRSFSGDTSTHGLKVLGHDSWQHSRPAWNQHAYNPRGILLDGTVPALPMQGWRHSEGNVLRVNPELPAGPAYAANGTLSWPRIGDASPEGLPITVRLGNGGLGLLPAGQVIEIYVGNSTQGSPSWTHTVEQAVRPGAYVDVDLLWTDAVSSPMTLTAVLRDAGIPALNCRSDDDTLTFAVDTSLLPDLTLGPDDLQAPAAVALGQQISIDVTVRNAGTAISAPSSVELRLGDAEQGLLINSVDLPLIAPGEAVELTADWDTRGLPESNYTLYASVDGANLVHEQEETNNIASRSVTLGAASLPDLSLEALHLADTAVTGDVVPVTIEVVNRGAATESGFDIALTVNGAEVQRYEDIVPLAAGAVRDVQLQLDTAGRSGLLQVAAVLDPDHLLDELDEGNNSLQDEVSVAPSSLNLTVTTDRLGYGPGDTVSIHLAVDSAETASQPAQLALRLIDDLGHDVALIHQQDVELGGTTELDLSWPLGDALPGSYAVVAELALDGNPRAQGLAAFSVAAELAVRMELLADQSSYSAGQTARLTGWVRNDSLNGVLDNLRADLQIRDQQLEVVFDRLEDLPSILPGTSHTLFAPWSLDGLPPGLYDARWTLRDPYGLALASADLQIVLEDSSEDGAGLFGTVAVDRAQLAAGAPLVTHFSLSNDGNVDYDALDLRLAVLAVPSGTEHGSALRQFPLSQGQGFADTEILSTSNLEPGDYLVTLNALLPAADRLLDTALVHIDRAVSILDATTPEGDSGTTQLDISVRLSSAATEAVTVDVQTVDGTARQGTDYQAISATLTFPPGTLEQVVSVQINGDLDVESDEVFLLQLDNAQGALVGDGIGRVLLRDEESCAGPQSIRQGSLDLSPGIDPTSGWAVAAGTWQPRFFDIPEGTAAQSTEDAAELVQEVDITAFADILMEGGVELAVSALTEVLGDDATASLTVEFLDAAGSLLDQHGASSTSLTGWQPLTVRQAPPVDTRTVRLRLAANGLGANGLATISWDDVIVQFLGRRTIFVDDLVLLEGDTAGSLAQVTIHLSCVAPQDISLNFVTSDGSAEGTTLPAALAGEDYQAASGTVTVAAGQLTATVDVPILGDLLNEEDEVFHVVLSDPTAQGPPILDSLADVVLRNDDGVALLSVADADAVEGSDSETHVLRFEVSLSAPSGRQVEVDFATAVDGLVGQATVGVDFVAQQGRLTFLPGETMQTVTVQLLDDDVAEGTETLRLQLSAPTHAALGRASAEGRLLDDEQASLTVDHPAVLEGESAVFRVRLSPAATRTVEVTYTTEDGHGGDAAVAGEDYLAASGRLVLAPGTRFVDVAVEGLDDAVNEPREFFQLVLSDPLNADLAVAEGTASLVDDDGFLLSASANETSEQATDHVVLVPVELSQPSSQTVTVQVTTEDGSAQSGLDYQEMTTTVTFDPGTTRVEVPVIILADSEAEDYETFRVRLSQPVGAQLFGETATVGVADDDRWVLVQDAKDHPEDGCFNLTSNIRNFDNSAVWNRTPIDLSQSFDKTFRNYFGSKNISRAGTVFVLQKESLGVVGGCCEDLAFNGISPSVGVEFDHGGSDHVAMGYNGSRFHNAHPPVYLPEILPDDQEHEVRMIWNAAAQELEMTLDGESLITYQGDLVNERFGGDPEVYWGWTGSYASGGNTTVQYFCDVDSCAHESTPTVSIGNAKRLEGDDGDVQILLPLTLSCPHTEDITVSYVTTDGTAVAGEDFRFAAQTVVFAAGEQSKTVVIDIFGDTQPEADETFYVDITSVDGAAPRHGRGIIELLSDEIPISVPRTRTAEGDDGPTEWETEILFASPIPVATTLSYQVVGDTAQLGSDVAAASGTLSMSAGQSSVFLPLQILSDSVVEDDETFFIDLTAPPGGVLVGQRVAVEIRDDDACPSANLLLNPSAEEPLVNDSVPGWTEAIGDLWQQATTDGPHDGDYYFYAGIIPFAELHQDVDVSGLAQRIDAGLQRFSFEAWARSRFESPADAARVVVEYRDATNTVILDSYDSGEHIDRNGWRWLNDLRPAPPGTRTIRVRLMSIRYRPSGNNARWDDLSLRALNIPTLAVTDVTVQEGVSGTTQAELQVTSTCPSDGSVRVDYLTQDGSATAGEDYASTFGTLHFPAGSSQRSILVPIFGDALTEGDETFSLHLLNPQAAGLSDAEAIVTVVDDEVALSLDNLTVHEQDDATEALLQLHLTSPSTLPVRVHLRTGDLEAVAGEDYVALDTEVEFAAGATSLQVPLTVLGDRLSEAAEECLRITLDAPINARLDNGEALVCILDDDITITLGDVSVSEGHQGETVAYLPVTLSRDAAEPITVTWSTSDDSALAGEDYVAASGQVTWPAGTTQAEIAVTVLGDLEEELTELFNVELSGTSEADLGHSSGADLGDGLGTVFIVDDDSCQSLDLLENSGAEDGVDGELPLDWQAMQGTWRRYTDGTVLARQGARYFNAASSADGTSDAELLQNVDVSAFAPWIDTGRQQFRIEGWLRTVDGAEASSGRIQLEYLDAQGTVLDGYDSGAVVSPGSWRQVTDLRLAPVGSRALRLRLLSQHGASGSHPVYFDALSLRSVGVPTVWLTSPGPVTDEGDLEGTLMTFEVVLSCHEGQPVHVDFATSDGGGGDDLRAQDGLDYLAQSGTLVLSTGTENEAGGLVQTVDVPILADGVREPQEYLTLTLSNLQGAVLLDASVPGVIADNDSPNIDRGYVSLETAPGDGQVKIDLGAFGDWGIDTLDDWVPFGRGDALFDVPGPFGLGATTYDATLLVRRQGAPEQYLSTAFVANSPNSRQPNPGFVEFGPTYAVSTFLVEGLYFELRQTLHDIFEDDERVGGVLVQTYDVTNRLTETTEVDFIRYFDGDIDLGSGTTLADGGGTRQYGDVEVIFQTDVPVAPEDTAAFVGLASQGGLPLASGRYEVAEWDPNVPSLENGGVPRDRVVRDANGDGLVDAGQNIDIALLLRNQITDIGPDETVTYRTFTYFGQAVLDDYQLNLPPDADAGDQIAVYEGSTVILDGSGSSDGDGQLVSYRWDLDDDGAFDDADEAQPEVFLEQDGSYPVTLQVIDDGGLGGTDRILLVVLEAPPTVDAGQPASVEPEQPFELVASYADPGRLDAHSATVAWGDGSIEDVAVHSVDGSGQVLASHAYLDVGEYMVEVCVTDDGGAMGCDTVQVTVEVGGDTAVCEIQPFDDGQWSVHFMGDADQGSATVQEDGSLHLSGDGSSLYHSGDNGVFYHRPVATSADFRLEVDVTDFPVDVGGDVRKVALMLRTGLGPYDPRVMVTFVPHLPAADPADPALPALQFDGRAVPGDGGVEIGNTVMGMPMPVRLALEKRGDVITTFYSNDGGQTWIRPQDATYHGAMEIDFDAFAGETLYAGLMVASYDTQVATTAELRDLQICLPDASGPYQPGAPPSCLADQAQDVLFLLDVSGSMTAPYGNSSKLQAAQAAITQLSNALAGRLDGSRAALVTYAGFRTPEENLAGAYQMHSGFSDDPMAVAALAEAIDGSTIDPGTTTPVALALEGVIDILEAESRGDAQTSVVWLTDGIPNIDGMGRGPDAYELEELQGISLYAADGSFLPWGQVAWTGHFNADIGTFDGEPLANAMFQLERLDRALPDALVYGLAIQGNGADLGTFNEDLLEYAAFVSGGRAFSGTSPDALLAAMSALLTDLECGGFGTASLGGRLWQDTDDDGIQALGEPSLGGVHLDLFDAAGFGLTSTVSAGDGRYAITDLPAGQYTVRVDSSTLPTDLDQPTYDADGIDTPHLATVTVTDGMLREDLDFGYRATPGDPSGEICILETFDGTALDPAWSLVELGDADQGQVALNGGTLELTSDGTSLFHSDDNAAWVYRPVQGDFRVETVVSAIVDDAGGDVRKACLMARQGTGPQDPRVMVCFIPHLPDPPVAALQFDVRHVEGSAEELATLVPNVFLPVALAIERQGNTFSVSYSRDGGSTWTEATGQLGGSVELDLPSEIYWGLAVSSYDPNITMTVAFEDAAVCQPSETNP